MIFRTLPLLAAGQPTAAQGCDPTYAGASVPIDWDVDCATGSGIAPAHVTGPARVVGRDTYRLD